MNVASVRIVCRLGRASAIMRPGRAAVMHSDMRVATFCADKLMDAGSMRRMKLNEYGVPDDMLGKHEDPFDPDMDKFTSVDRKQRLSKEQAEEEAQLRALLESDPSLKKK
mmetsp:Transcript_75643/g.153069  ORF Transcript_75643/g.153069 Transcript_75643/m.153069 type:complete len:110 (-) Transcript_75643:23-352(-)